MSFKIVDKSELNVDLRKSNQLLTEVTVASKDNLGLKLDVTEGTTAVVMIAIRKSSDVAVFEEVSIKNGQLEIAWMDLLQQWHDHSKFYADVFIQIEDQLFKPILDVEEKSRFLSEIAVNEENISKDQPVYLVYGTKGTTMTLAITKGTLYQMAAEKLRTSIQVTKFKMSKTGYRFELEISSDDELNIEPQKFAMIQRTTIENREIDYPVEISKKSAKEIILRGKIDKHGEWVPFNWDLYIEFTSDNWSLRGLLEVKKMLPLVALKVDQDQFKKKIDLPDSHIMYPYMTVAGNLAFTYRPLEAYETPKVLRTERWAVRYAKLMSPIYRRRNIWIGYEKNSFGEHDNGYHFFKYVYENNKHPEMYYVIRENSPENKNLDGMRDKTLKFMSWKYFVYLYSARLLVSSDSKFHVYNMQRRDSALAKALMRKKNVFLQHGVNGMKKVPVFHQSQGWLDFIIAPSQFEKDHITVPLWGYEANDVAVTGYARWDSYEDKTGSIPFKQIFVMPTWRNWMEGMSREKFVTTPFYHEYQNFLNSPELKEMLKESNTRIAFFLHPYFKDYVDLFDIDESVIDKYGYLEVDMGEEIQKSSLMISDYSSVLWDMYYLKKPTIFFQFDREAYLQDEGAYLDYDNDAFGDMTFTADETITAIKKYIHNDFVEDDEIERLRPKYFNYVDKNNAKRIYQAISANEERLTELKEDITTRRIKKRVKAKVAKLPIVGKAAKKVSKPLKKFVRR